MREVGDKNIFKKIKNKFGGYKKYMYFCSPQTKSGRSLRELNKKGIYV